MSYQFVPLFLLPLFAGMVGLIIAWYAWQLRPRRGATALTLLTVAALVWSLGYALEIAGTDLTTKLLWAEVQYLGIATVPVCWLIFALEYAGRDHWLTRRNLVLLSIIPGVTILLTFTTASHGLIWSAVNLGSTTNAIALTVSHGFWFWVYWIYAQLMVLAGTIMIIRALIESPPLYRWQAFLILLAALLPWLGNLVYVTGLNPAAPLDLTPFAFVLSAGAITLALSRFRLLSLTPIAYATVIESMNDGMFVIDAHDHLADLNPAAQQLIGLSAAQAIGQPLTAIFQAWPDLVVHLRQMDEIREELGLGSGAARRHYELHLSPLKNRRGKVTGHVLLVRDITELVEARDQAVEADRLKGELLARVSHELRTPLSAILGYAELLMDGSFGPLDEHQQRAIRDMTGSTQELTILVSELLDSAQLEAHALRLRIRPFGPADMLQRVESTMAVLAQHKGLSFTTSLDPQLPAALLGDETRLRQILINLIDNAIKFTDDGTVQARLYVVDQEHWAMEVVDTGAGIPAEAQQYIFDPFRQVDGSITREHRGTGLGLSIVKSLIELMGGSICLKSEVDRGTTFTLTLPISPDVQQA